MTTGTDKLETLQQAADVLAWVVRPMAVHCQAAMLGGYAAETLTMLQQGQFAHLNVAVFPDYAELMRITDILTYSFEEMTWVQDEMVSHVGVKLDRASDLYITVVKKIGMPSLIPSSPFTNMLGLWKRLLPIFQEHQESMKQQPASFLKIFKVAADSRGTKQFMDAQETEQFFKDKIAGVQPSTIRYRQEEYYSEHLLKMEARMAESSMSVHNVLNPMGEFEDSEIMKAPLPRSHETYLLL
jgi:hypothetical protein